MSAPLFITRLARQDLRAAWSYVAQHSQDAADRLVEDLGRAVQSLQDNPFLGVARKDFGANIRIWTVRKPYIIIYQVSSKQIRILRILHHARDIRRFFP